LVLSAFAKPNIGDWHPHRWASQKRSAQPTTNVASMRLLPRILLQ
jgi:hypothetical protein